MKCWLQCRNRCPSRKQSPRSGAAITSCFPSCLCRLQRIIQTIRAKCAKHFSTSTKDFMYDSVLFIWMGCCSFCAHILNAVTAYILKLSLKWRSGLFYENNVFCNYFQLRGGLLNGSCRLELCWGQMCKMNLRRRR